jgi:hypothetical protein
VEPEAEELEQAEQRAPLADVVSRLDAVLPSTGLPEEELFGEAPEGFGAVPRSFASLFGSEDEEEAAEVDPSLMLVNCGLSEATVSALEQRGITALFPIQKVVFEPAMRGADLIARAKTGSGERGSLGRGVKPGWGPTLQPALTSSPDSLPHATAQAPCMMSAPCQSLAPSVCQPPNPTPTHPPHPTQARPWPLPSP